MGGIIIQQCPFVDDLQDSASIFFEFDFHSMLDREPSPSGARNRHSIKPLMNESDFLIVVQRERIS
jgi:hypothetical protein